MILLRLSWKPPNPGRLLAGVGDGGEGIGQRRYYQLRTIEFATGIRLDSNFRKPMPPAMPIPKPEQTTHSILKTF
jgi:hypothetical protein